MGNINEIVAKFLEGVPDDLDVEDGAPNDPAAQTLVLRQLATGDEADRMPGNFKQGPSTTVDEERRGITQALRDAINRRLRTYSNLDLDSTSSSYGHAKEERLAGLSSGSIGSNIDGSNRNPYPLFNSSYINHNISLPKQMQNQDPGYCDNFFRQVRSIRAKQASEQGRLREPCLDRMNDGMPPVGEYVLRKFEANQQKKLNEQKKLDEQQRLLEEAKLRAKDKPARRRKKTKCSSSKKQPRRYRGLSPLREELEVEALTDPSPKVLAKRFRRCTIPSLDSIVHKKGEQLRSHKVHEDDPQLRWQWSFIQKHFNDQRAIRMTRSARRYSTGTSNKHFLQVTIGKDLQGPIFGNAVELNTESSFYQENNIVERFAQPAEENAPEPTPHVQSTLPSPQGLQTLQGSSSKPERKEEVEEQDGSPPSDDSFSNESSEDSTSESSDDTDLEGNAPAELRGGPIFINHGLIWYLSSRSQDRANNPPDRRNASRGRRNNSRDRGIRARNRSSSSERAQHKRRVRKVGWRQP